MRGQLRLEPLIKYQATSRTLFRVYLFFWLSLVTTFRAGIVHALNFTPSLLPTEIFKQVFAGRSNCLLRAPSPTYAVAHIGAVTPRRCRSAVAILQIV